MQRWSAALALALCAGSVKTAHGQHLSLWLDAQGAHSRPPAGASVDAANYGLLGARLRVDGRGSAFGLGVTAGRGADDGAGAWAAGRAELQRSRVRGHLDYGVRAEGSGLAFLAPVQLHGGAEYTQRNVTGSLTPFAGISVARFRFGVDATVTAGRWQTQVTPAPTGGGPLPPPLGRPRAQAVEESGDIVIAGGGASLLRAAGPVTVEVRASGYDVRNAVAEGLHRGADMNVAVSLRALDLALGARVWDSPLRATEIGGHAGIGLAAGDDAYVQLTAGRTVTDLVHGAAGGFTLSAGVAVRVGSRHVGPPSPARVVAAGAGGHRVLFTLRRAGAHSVAVAGDFSGWEPRPLTRSGTDVWQLETVLPAGVYHYSFVVDGETWLVPDHAPGIVDDGFGQRNATLIVNDTRDGMVP